MQKKVIWYNRGALICLTLVACAMYAGPIDLSDDALGMIFFLFTPPVILVHLFISLYLEKNKHTTEPVSYILYGTLIVMYALCILIRGIKFY